MNFKVYRDTYFFNAKKALEVAKEQNTLMVLDEPITNSVFFLEIEEQKRQEFYKDLQICYYAGTKIENGPANLIYVPVDTLFDFFKASRLRYPEIIDFDASDFSQSEQEKIIGLFRQLVQNARVFKNTQALNFMEIIKLNKPNFNEPLRIFLMGNRHTTVMQYVSQSIAYEFKAAGVDVKFSIEQNAMEALDPVWHYKECAEFNPHITININHLNNEFLNDGVFNFVWFQDPMEILLSSAKIELRKRDFIYSLFSTLDLFMDNKNIPYKRQNFCINKTEFFIDKNIKRRKKIVFVGSSYNKMMPDNFFGSGLHKHLMKMFTEGVQFSKNILNELAILYKVDYSFLESRIYPFIVRDMSVLALCEMASEIDFEVEIYGYDWDHYEHIKPFYKGPLAYGRELRDVYNSATYALASHATYVVQNRVLEAIGCGCTPIVYDCRKFDKPPFYEDALEIFLTKQDLFKILTRKKSRKYKTKEIIKSCSYKYMIKGICKTVRKNLKNG